MSTEMLGILNISLSVFGVISTFICSGIAITIARFVSINHYNNGKHKNSNLVYSGMILCTIIAIIICILLIMNRSILIKLLSNEQSYLLLLCMTPAILTNAIYTPFRAYLQGREYYFQSSLVELIEQVLRIIACFVVYLLFKNIESIYAPVIAMSVAGTLSTILGMYYYKRCDGKLTIKKPRFKKLITTSTPITMVKLLSTIMMPIITIVLPIRLISIGFSNNEALSLLGIATGMTLPLISIPGTIVGSLATALIPQISTLHESNQNETISNQINSSIKFTIIVTTLLIPVFIVLGKPICELIYDNSYAGELLSNASWIMLPLGINQITTTILNSMGHEKSSFVYYLYSVVVLAICIYLLPIYIGIKSIIWALGTSSIVVSLFNIKKIIQITKLKTSAITLSLLCYGLCIPTIFLNNYIYGILINYLPIFACIVIVCITTIFSLILLYYAFGIINLKQIIKKAKSTIKLKKYV